MRFIVDPAKSRANRTKHGIDFSAAQALWNYPDYVEFPARSGPSLGSKWSAPEGHGRCRPPSSRIAMTRTLLRIIDAEATRLGVSRQAFMKIRISDALNVRIVGNPCSRQVADPQRRTLPWSRRV